MKRIIYFALLCITLATNGFAMEANKWDLDANCPYTCRTMGEPITYRELLAVAQVASPNDKNWEIVNTAKVHFGLPVDQAVQVMPPFGFNQYSKFLDAERDLNSLFFTIFKHGLLGTTRTELGRELEQNRRGYSALLYDLDRALTILHVNTYNYTGGNC